MGAKRGRVVIDFATLDPSRTDDDPRGDAAGVLGAPPRAGGVGIELEAVQLCLHWFCIVSALGHRHSWSGWGRGVAGCHSRVDRKTRDRWRGARAHRIAVGQAAHFSRSGVSRDGISARCARLARSSSAGGLNRMRTSELIAEVLRVLAAGLLLISFAMLSGRRTQQLINLFAWQGAMLFVSTCLVAYSSGLTEMYYSAALTLILKVIALPWILHRLIKRLGAQQIGR